MISDIEKGKYLAVIRERANKKQTDVARIASISAPTLSRIEAGERPPNTEEIDSLLMAIGSPEALRLKETFKRSWQIIEQPRLGHPDEELLWDAERALESLSSLATSENLKNVIVRRLEEYKSELKRISEIILNTTVQIAFDGCIGVGKSTVISRLTGLELFSPNSTFPTAVLEAGGGGVTLCEVHIYQGPDYGIIIEAKTDEEIRDDVQDFADFLMAPAIPASIEALEASENDTLGISRELVRVIKNMAKLTPTKEKAPDGKMITKDPAKELATTFTTSKDLAIEILSRMNLHKRDRRNIWYSNNVGKEPLEWLRDEFELINNGRHPDFTVPKRIEVIIPRAILNSESLSIHLIDTKGIDQTAQRADLENHFNEPQTISILCSGFLEAPSLQTQQLLRRSIAGGTQYLQVKAGILVLPRPGDALSIKDDLGKRAQTSSEGYDIKQEQMENSLRVLNLPDLKSVFFNSREDNPDVLRSFILKRIEDLREHHRGRLKQVIKGSLAFMSDLTKSQVEEVQRAAARRLAIWFKTDSTLPSVTVHLHDSLLTAVATTHASSIRASVRREGDWPNLDYSHQLGFGARIMTTASTAPKLEKFRAIAENLLADPDYSDAYNLIQQAQRVLESGMEDILRKIQLMGFSAYTNGLKSDSDFWKLCEDEWGRGSGYRDRVRNHNVDWFSKSAHLVYQNQVQALIAKEWSELLARLAPLLEVE